MSAENQIIRFCPNCAAQIHFQNANFCSSCQYPLKQANAPNAPLLATIVSIDPNGPLVVNMPVAGELPEEDTQNLNYDASKFNEYFRLTVNERNCGCERMRKNKPGKCCNFPMSLWTACHVWSLFYMIDIVAIAIYFAAIGVDYRIYLLLFAYGIIPCITEIYALHKCIPNLMYVIRLCIWIQLMICAILYFSIAYSMWSNCLGCDNECNTAYDTDTECDEIKAECDEMNTKCNESLIELGITFGQHFVAIWMDNVFSTTHIWAKYYKTDNGVYPSNMDIDSFPMSYVVCFCDPIMCFCLPLLCCCLACNAKTGNVEGNDHIVNNFASFC